MAGMGMARQNTGMAGMEILEASFRGEISIPKYRKNKIFLEKKRAKLHLYSTIFSIFDPFQFITSIHIIIRYFY
jgi:hypothetical protein